MAGYLFDNAWEHARERLELLEQRADRGTLAHLETIGVGPGWSCLEVGAGAGSVARWLADRVGTGGAVVAADIDTRFLEAQAHPGIAVRRVDVATESLPAGPFDLVHARTLLMHLPARAAVLRRMADAVRPGGFLLVEEPDFLSWVPDGVGDPDAAELFLRSWQLAQKLQTAGGQDLFFGRRLYGELCQLGFEGVEAEGRVHMMRGGSPYARYYRLTVQQRRDALAAELGAQHPLLDQADRYIAVMDDPAFVWVGPILMSAWGRRPLG